MVAKDLEHELCGTGRLVRVKKRFDVRYRRSMVYTCVCVRVSKCVDVDCRTKNGDWRYIYIHKSRDDYSYLVALSTRLKCDVACLGQCSACLHE